MEEKVLYESKGIALQFIVSSLILSLMFLPMGIFLLLLDPSKYVKLFCWGLIILSIYLLSIVLEAPRIWTKIYTDRIEARTIKLVLGATTYCPITDVRNFEVGKYILIVRTGSGKYYFFCKDPKRAAEVLKPLIP